MCLVKKPKVVAAATDKEPAIITNPYLDGLPAIERARTGGVRSLTIPRGASGTASTAKAGSRWASRCNCSRTTSSLSSR